MIDPKDITACLITKDPMYPLEALAPVLRAAFKDVLIETRCTSVARRYALVCRAKTPWVYVQDDDASVLNIEHLLQNALMDQITCLMKEHYLGTYAFKKDCLIGWGAVFPVRLVQEEFLQHVPKFPRELYRTAADVIFTWLNHPQLRLPGEIADMPSAIAPDRMSMQPDHYKGRDTVRKILEEQCS